MTRSLRLAHSFLLQHVSSTSPLRASVRRTLCAGCGPITIAAQGRSGGINTASSRYAARLQSPRTAPHSLQLRSTTPTIRCASGGGKLPSNSEEHDTKPSSTKAAAPITQQINATRERTKELGAKVRSSLSGLTPHENIYNIPNFLTVTRLVAAPAIAYLVLHDQHTWALALFAYAGITDMIDGWMARKWKLQTVVGSVIDPGADKALMIVLITTLAVKGALPLYLATLILGRDASLLGAAIYYRYASLPAPKTFMRYWDFSLPSAEVHPTTVSKANTFLQLILIGSTLALPVVTADSHNLGLLADIDLGRVMTYFQWLVAGTTVWSGLSYSYLKDAVKILGDDEKLKAKQGSRGRAIIGVTFGSVVAVAAWQALSKGDDERGGETDAQNA